MSLYNDLNIPMVVGSLENQADDRSISRTRSGGVKMRLLFTGAKRVLPIQHKAINYTQKAALQAFYDANRNEVFQFTYDSVTYDVVFADSLNFTPIGNGLNDVVVTFAEV